MEILAAVIIGFILDLIFGDPHWLPHPVRLIGWLISNGEKLLRRLLPETRRSELLGGMILTILVTCISSGVPYFILSLAGRINYVLELALSSIFCYQILAAKSLKTESMRVYYHLKNNDMGNARKYLSWIVGRDTQNLGEEGITKAAVETVAENTSDGVVAPLIFLIIGGAPLGFFYKAVNTLDSMIGYKNDKYIYFGKFAARLDDVMNFIPAIVSAYAMIASSFINRLDYKNAFRIYKRDRRNHSSPNSARTEAACAGALNLQLAGDACYFGKLVRKPTIGDNNRNIQIDDIPTANKLMYTTAIISMISLCMARLIIFLIIIS
ncbi:MAG: cobalamin biosynthesis protein CobD [Eubacterium sp.]|jgi:adenosylcobinamide-phosphate synthase|nr:cobalamin biosynthesis protein CobD [Eubacterium sp.]